MGPMGSYDKSSEECLERQVCRMEKGRETEKADRQGLFEAESSRKVAHTPTPKAVEIEDEKMEEEPVAPMSSTGVDASKEVAVPEVELKKVSMGAGPGEQPQQPVDAPMEAEGAAAKAEVNVEPEKAVSSEKEVGPVYTSSQTDVLGNPLGGEHTLPAVETPRGHGTRRSRRRRRSSTTSSRKSRSRRRRRRSEGGSRVYQSPWPMPWLGHGMPHGMPHGMTHGMQHGMPMFPPMPPVGMFQHPRHGHGRPGSWSPQPATPMTPATTGPPAGTGTQAKASGAPLDEFAARNLMRPPPAP